MTLPRPAVRDMVPADRAALLDLWVAAWAAAMPELDFEARRPWLDRHLDALVANGARILVADRGSRPAGFLSLDPGSGYLDQLAVDPAHQGFGVGSALMRAAKALSPGGLRLDVNRDNETARRFYAGQGFVAVSAGSNPTSGLPTLALSWAGAAPGAGAARVK